MPIATSFVQYNNTSPFALKNSDKSDLPLLDYGTIVPGSWSNKFVIGLRFQGMPVKNILFWMDSNTSTVYPHGSVEGNLLQNIFAKGYIIKALVLPNDDDPNYNSALAIYNQSAPYSSWASIPVTQSTALELGHTELNINLESFSVKIALVAFVPTGEPNLDLKNMRLFTEYEVVAA